MDREMVERHLAQAEAHIETGYKNIARQREVIAHMEREGQDTASARHTLTQFEELQRCTSPTASGYCGSFRDSRGAWLLRSAAAATPTPRAPPPLCQAPGAAAGAPASPD